MVHVRELRCDVTVVYGHELHGSFSYVHLLWAQEPPNLSSQTNRNAHHDPPTLPDDPWLGGELICFLCQVPRSPLPRRVPAY